jgi:hypothetical protein
MRAGFVLMAFLGLILCQAPAVGDAGKPPPVPEQDAPVWTVLDPHEFKAARGTTLTKQADKSILATGQNPTPEVYTIQAHTTLKGITAVRLEALTDPTMPQNGPGRAANGNFVLNNFQVRAAPKNDPAKDQAVAFGKASADFSQDGYNVQSILTGNTPQGGGWAVAPQTSRKHVAVFELKGPVGHDEGTALTFVMTHNWAGGEHSIGRFRLSVTSSKPPYPFWEGLKSLVWTPLDPHQLKAARGTTLTKQGDKSILAGGPNPTPETYTIQAHTTLKEITAIRLEVLTDPSLPQNGPGRAGNANFVLNGFQVQASPRKDPAKTEPVALSKATADFSQDGYGVQSVLTGNTPQGGGWAIDPQEGRRHAAVFELKTPIRHEDGMTLTFTMVQQWAGSTHNIGKFRLSVTGTKPPYAFELLDVTADDLAAFWADLGNPDVERAKLAVDNLFESGHALGLLKAELKAERVKVDALQVERWIGQLNDNDYDVREKATSELEKLGLAAAPALMRSVALAPSLEAHRRMEKLLQRVNEAPPVSRQLRAMDVLVRINSPATRELLQTLAKGPADAILTEAAISALALLDEAPR